MIDIIECVSPLTFFHHLTAIILQSARKVELIEQGALRLVLQVLTHPSRYKFDTGARNMQFSF